jgi:PhnB protein
MASDSMASPQNPGNSIALCLNCSSIDELNTFFTNLSAGGRVKLPLHQSFWGATYGELTDKFGIAWILNFTRSATIAQDSSAQP